MPLFIIIITLVIALNLRLKYVSKKKDGLVDTERYLKDDYESNFSRVRPIDEQMFIRLTEADFPFRDVYNEEVKIESDIIRLQKRVRLNLEMPIIKSDIKDNIEIKKRFGATNLQVVADGEENHTRLIHNLNHWAKLLEQLGNEEDAVAVLEKAVWARSDISETYILLYGLYNKTGRDTKASEIIDKIEELPNTAKKRALSFIESTKGEIE